MGGGGVSTVPACVVILTREDTLRCKLGAKHGGTVEPVGYLASALASGEPFFPTRSQFQKPK